MKATGLVLHRDLQGKTEFSVNHFAGPVPYDASDFVTKNNDKFPNELVELFATSSNPLLQHGLQAIHKEHAAAVAGKKKNVSIMSKFQAHLRNLLGSMERHQIRYIRCIKPNEALDATYFDHSTSLRQLRCAGLIAAVDLSRGFFPSKLSFSFFDERFQCLLPALEREVLSDTPLYDKVNFMLSSFFSETIERYRGSEFTFPYACGKTKVFFRAGALEYLEAMRYDAFTKATLKAQTWYRGAHVHRRYSHLRKGMVRIQSQYRGEAPLRLFRKARKGIILLQALVRGRSTKLRYDKQLWGLLIIQSYMLVYLERRNRACLTLQTTVRKMLAVNRYKSQRKAVSSLQRWARLSSFRRLCALKRNAAMTITNVMRGIEIRRRYQKKRRSLITIQKCARVYLSTRKARKRDAAQIITRWLIKHMTKASTTDASTTGSSINTEKTDIDRLCRERIDDLQRKEESFRQEIEDLRGEILQVTAEADQNRIELEADFEERIAEYEYEVLDLKRALKMYEEEKQHLRIEMKTVKKRHKETLAGLQQAALDTNESHKEHVRKLAEVLDKSNQARQEDSKNYSKQIEDMGRLHQKRVHVLEKEIRDLRSLLSTRKVTEKPTSEADKISHILRISRKLEQMCTADNVSSVVEEALRSSDPGVATHIDSHLSSKIRRLLYRLEEEVVELDPSPPKCTSDVEVVGLQNQLVRAYEDIEMLRDEIAELRSVGLSYHDQYR